MKPKYSPHPHEDNARLARMTHNERQHFYLDCHPDMTNELFDEFMDVNWAFYVLEHLPHTKYSDLGLACGPFRQVPLRLA